MTATATALQGEMSAAANAVLNVSKDLTAGEAVKEADPQAVQVVSEVSQSLKSKPESDFTTTDFLPEACPILQIRTSMLH